MSEVINKISIKENNAAKNDSKKRKIKQEDIKDFAKKIHKKHLKLNEEEIKKSVANILGTYFICKQRRKFFRGGGQLSMHTFNSGTKNFRTT